VKLIYTSYARPTKITGSVVATKLLHRALDAIADLTLETASAADKAASQRGAEIVFRADPSLARAALGRTALNYSLVGVTHTISTHEAYEQLTALRTRHLGSFDALVCTSSRAQAVVQSMVTTRVQLPVIPLCVEPPVRGCTPRTEGEFHLLVAGRISPISKASILPIILAVQRASENSRRKLNLTFAGTGETHHVEACKKFAPDVHVCVAYGNSAAWLDAWSQADVCLSLPDNIQETFGMVAAEAMSVGLPVIATDWAGHSDFIDHGAEGFLIPVYGSMNSVASAWTMEPNYHRAAAEAVYYDIAQVAAAINVLEQTPDLCTQMGAAGYKRYQNYLSVEAVGKQYLELFEQLRTVRAGYTLSPAQGIPSHFSSYTQRPPLKPVFVTATDAQIKELLNWECLTVPWDDVLRVAAACRKAPVNVGQLIMMPSYFEAVTILRKLGFA
jgi:glycosyltransferase involved in cell wall biosynthesis